MLLFFFLDPFFQVPAKVFWQPDRFSLESHAYHAYGGFRTELSSPVSEDTLVKNETSAAYFFHPGNYLYHFVIPQGFSVLAMAFHDGKVHSVGHNFRIRKPDGSPEVIPGQFEEVEIITVVKGVAQVDFIKGYPVVKIVFSADIIHFSLPGFLA